MERLRPRMCEEFVVVYASLRFTFFKDIIMKTLNLTGIGVCHFLATNDSKQTWKTRFAFPEEDTNAAK